MLSKSQHSDHVNGHVNGHAMTAYDRDNRDNYSNNSNYSEMDDCLEEKNHYYDRQGLGTYDQGQGLDDFTVAVERGIIPSAPAVPARSLPGTNTRTRASSSTTIASSSSPSSSSAAIPIVLPPSNNNINNKINDATTHGVPPSGTIISSSGSKNVVSCLYFLTVVSS